MRLATFELDTPLGVARRLGVVNGNAMLDANLAYRHKLEATDACEFAEAVANAVLPPDLLRYLQTGDVAARALSEAVTYGFAKGGEAGLITNLSEVRLLSPLPRPVSIREFGQYKGHIGRGGAASIPQVWYELPVYWKGNPSSVIGAEATVPWPSFTERMDIELEIAAVIGRAGINIPQEEAMGHVAGFTIFNDVSARDRQFKEMEKGTGPAKGKDFCNILGPVLVTPDEIDVSDLDVSVRVNGAQWARSSTRGMQRTWEEIIAYVSTDEWLVPGDVLVSGTVEGCSGLDYLGWPDSGPILSRGDLVELEVAGLGVLRNKIGGTA